MAWQRSWWLNSWRSSLFHHWKKNKILSESKALNHWLWHSLPEWPIRSPIYRRRGRKKNILKTSNEDRRGEYLQKGQDLWVSSSLFQTILFALWRLFQAKKVDKVDPWSRNEQKEEKNTEEEEEFGESGGGRVVGSTGSRGISSSLE